MEVFFKNLSSESTPTERMVEDLGLLVEDAEHLVKVSSANFAAETRVELLSALDRIKRQCELLKANATRKMEATDRLIRRYPYQALGVALGVGLVAGWLAHGRCPSTDDAEAESE